MRPGRRGMRPRPTTATTGQGRHDRLSRAAVTAAGPDRYAARVLDVVDSIAPGRVMSYGDVAEYLGEGGPRQVGRVMALWGGSAPWWRGVQADGGLLRGHERAALAEYRAEGTPLRTSRAGVPPRID